MKNSNANAEEIVAARIKGSLKVRLRLATDRTKTPYAPTRTQVVLRGIELALDELEKRAPR